MPTQQPIMGWSSDTKHTTTTEYFWPGENGSTYSSNVRQIVIPTGGKFKQLNVKIDTAPGVGKKYHFSLNVNGTNSTTLIGDIRDSQTTLTVTEDHTISQGDLVTIEIDPQQTPTAFTRMDYSLIWEPTTDDEYIFCITAANPVLPGTTEYAHLTDNSTWDTSSSARQSLIGVAGTLKKLTAYATAAPGAGQTYDVTLRTDNGGSMADTSVTVQLDNADFDKSDNTNTATIAAGDLANMKVVPTAGSGANGVAFSVVFVPTTTGQIPYISGTQQNLDSTTAEYNSLINTGATTWNATQRLHKIVNAPITIIQHYIELDGSPGAGKSYQFEVLKNSVAEAALTITISNTDTTGNQTSVSVAFADGDTVDFYVTPSGTPAARDAFWGGAFTYAGIAADPAEPAFQFEVVNFTKDDTGTANAVDHVQLTNAFTPKAIILWSNGSVTTGGESADYRMSFGFSDTVNDSVVSGWSDDNVSPTATSKVQRDDAIALYFSAASTVGHQGTISGVSQGDFRIQWGTNDSVAAKYSAVVIGGSDVTGVQVGSVAKSTTAAPTTQNVSTDADVQNGDFLMLLGTRRAANSIGTDVETAIGMATGTSNQGFIGSSSQEAVSTANTYRYQRTNQVYTTWNPSNSVIDSQCDFGGFTASGFDLDWTTNNTGRSDPLQFLVIKGGQWEVGNGTSRITTPGTKSYTTAFQPVGMFNFAFCRATATTWQTHNRIGIGATDGTTSAWLASADNDNVSTTVGNTHTNQNAASIVACVHRINNSSATGGPAMDGEGRFDSFNATDFTINYIDADTIEGEFVWLVAAANAVGGLSIPIAAYHYNHHLGSMSS